MTPDLPARSPGTHEWPDLCVLERVRDALARLPDSALHPSYFELPGDCLASPLAEHGVRP